MNRPPNKITHYIPRSLPINSSHSHKNFIVKRYSKIVQIKLDHPFKTYFFPSSADRSQFFKLFKLLKYTKTLKKLKLDHYVIYKSKLALPLMISLIKRLRRIQQFDIRDFWFALEKFRTKLNLWMKYLLSLQKLTFKFTENFITLTNHQQSFIDNMQSFLKNLRYQNHIKSIDLQLPPRISFAIPIFLQISQYPRSSLQKLQLSCKERPLEYLDTEISKLNSLSSFKKLHVFALQLTQNLSNITQILNTLPSLPHLASLNLNLPVLNFPYQTYPINPQTFNSIKHLSLSIPHEATQNSILHSLNLANLESLRLSLYLLDNERTQEISTVLSKLKNLKNLDLCIRYFEGVSEIITIFFESIAANLELLTSLKFLFKGSHGSLSEFLPPEALDSLEKIFNKSNKIQEFSLECKELDISRSSQRLIEILEPSAPNLKKLKLNTSPFTINRENFNVFLRFLGALENIRVLKLHCLDIDSGQLLKRMTSCLVKLKKIRAIRLGAVDGKVGEETFIECVEKIVEKRGVCTFKCQTKDDLKTSLGFICYPFPPLSFEEISRKNPFLEFVSSDLFTLIKKDEQE